MMKTYGAVLASLLVSGVVLGQQPLRRMIAQTVLSQQEVMLTGQTTSSPPETRTVKVDNNGYLLTTGSSSSGGASGTHGACTVTTMNVGTSATLCPATPRADRASLLIELTQSGETLRVQSDGTNTASATVGVAVADSSGYTDNLSGTVSTSCRCTAATCAVTIVECP